ncbi:glycosyltransferase family 39 protein [Enterovirga sp.]|uniref:ArnT family glycosyltransferase n=1 Tax=Enterovirga sp. TaxID=2026350 RepID=UPI002B9701F8|nr:glycosyltransferase family 39 protein [Enterovirga sp.]HMO30921.1 glycosyltransferase family 39 protein [Enterovirga sp.]
MAHPLVLWLLPLSLSGLAAAGQDVLPSWLAILIWAGALALTWRIADPTTPGSPAGADTPSGSGGECVAVAALTALAFCLRGIGLSELPLAVHGDEGEMGVLAQGILRGEPLAPFGLGFYDQPLLFHYLQAMSLAAFPDPVAGLRITSAVFGAACVPLVYCLGKTLGGRSVGYAAAFLLAVSHFHIHYSRLGLNNMATTASAVAALAVLAGIDHRSSQRRLVSLGLIVGVSQYFYFGSRLIAVFAGAWVAALWLRRTIDLPRACGFAWAALVSVAPLLWSYARRPDALVARMSGVSIFSPPNVVHTLQDPAAALPGDGLRLFLVQARRTISFLLGAADRSAFYATDLPAFDIVTLGCFWAGLTVLVLSRGQARALLLAWLGSGLLLAGLLTIDQPNGPRLLVLTPAIALVGAIGVASVRDRICAIVGPRWAALVAVLFAGSVLALNVDIYFRRFPASAGGVLPTLLGRAIIDEGPRVAFLLGQPHIFGAHGTIRFLTAGRDVRDFRDAAEIAEALRTGGKVLLLALPNRLDDLRGLEARFPGGVRTEHRDQHGRIICVAYLLAGS